MSFRRSTTIEDCYDDDDDHAYQPALQHPLPRLNSHHSSNSSLRLSPSHQSHNSPMFRKRMPANNSRYHSRRSSRPLPPRHYYAVSDDNEFTGSEDEQIDDQEDLHRAMHDLALQDNHNFERFPGHRPLSHRSSIDYDIHGPPINPAAAGYYRFDDNLDLSPYGPPPPPPPPPYLVPPHHLQEGRYPHHGAAPPPPLPLHPPPHPQWMGYQPMMMDDMSPHMGPMYQQSSVDLPFVRRSASSRSYNRRNHPNSRPTSRRQELFRSHDDSEPDEEEFYHDDVDSEEEQYGPYPPYPLSRRTSMNSNGSKPVMRKRRANSLSSMPPSFMMNHPRGQGPPPPGAPFYPGGPPPMHHPRMNPHFGPPPPHIHPMSNSMPNSPQSSDDSDTDSEHYAPSRYGPHPGLVNTPNIAGVAVGPPGGAPPNRRIGRSLSFSGGFPPHPQPVNMAPPPPAGAMQPPPMILQPPPMPHPMMDNNNLQRRASMFSMAPGGMGGDLFEQMINNPTQPMPPHVNSAPVTPSEHPSSANASIAGDIPPHPPQLAPPQQPPQAQNMPMTPSSNQMPPIWGPAAMAAAAAAAANFPSSPGIANMLNPQQNMMPTPHQPPPPPPGGPPHPGMHHQQPMMFPPPMFNNPMMAQTPMWNFMPEMLFGNGGNGGGDFPLPFMDTNDPNLIAQFMNGGPGNNPMNSPHMNPHEGNGGGGGGPGGGGPGGPGGPSTPSSNMGGPQTPRAVEEEVIGGHNEHSRGDDMMHGHPPPQPPPQAPMLRRGLSMLGGLFGGGGNGYREDFPGNGGGPMFGNFSAPIQGGNGGQSKKEARLARQYEELGQFYCWRRIDGTDSPFESFSIPNQKIIAKKLRKNPQATQIMLGKEKKLPGEIMIDVQQNRGCYLSRVNGEQVLVQLEIKLETYGGNNFVFGNGQQGPQQQW